MAQCAWCDTELDLPGAVGRPPATHAVSHGICRRCLVEQLAALNDLPARPFAEVALTRQAPGALLGA